MLRTDPLATRLRGFGTTIFAEMSALAAETGAINLGQGFPDVDGPDEVRQVAINAIARGMNQYPPGIGVPELRHAIALHQQRFYDLTYDESSETLVTTGATEAIAASLLALCEPGDEVILFEPFYDSYAACIAMAGGQPVTVRLHAPTYEFDPAELARAFSPRTRLLILNTPHNPTGKVFSPTELERIASLCDEHDVVAVTDEVYEHMVFDGRHVPLASLPGMRDRTLTISSGGKTFSFTGWKVGWVCGRAELVSAVRAAKQFLTYVSGAPFQLAIAVGLGLDDSYFTRLAADLREKRDLLGAGLARLGFDVHPVAGTYFLTTDIRPLGETDGAAFCRALPGRCGVVAVPSSVFYAAPGPGDSFVRFTFCKRREVLDEALERLLTLDR
jgi:N-succinyldiaminopimelate aminotransferase